MEKNFNRVVLDLAIANKVKIWVMGIIFFLTFLQLFSLFAMSEGAFFSEKILLILVLILMVCLWAQEAHARDRIQRMNEHLIAAQDKLENAEVDTISTLIRLVESKAPYVYGHSARVARLAGLITERMDYSPASVEVVQRAAYLHDLGKLAIKDAILEKTGPLNEEEIAIIRRHPETAEGILSKLKFLHLERKIIRHCHERIDGKGYPDGLKGKEIPLESRIIAVAETFDEMNSDTFYHKAFSPERIKEELAAVGGDQLDEAIVDLCLMVLKENPDLWEDRGQMRNQDI